MKAEYVIGETQERVSLYEIKKRVTWMRAGQIMTIQKLEEEEDEIYEEG